MTSLEFVQRYAAFTDTPDGGNPAGVVLRADELTPAQMQSIAAEVGYSETAFVGAADSAQPRTHPVRYFTPEAEVPFCGHATIATGIALGQRHGAGAFRLKTEAGEIGLHVISEADGAMSAALTSVAPETTEIADTDLAEVLDALGWRPDELEGALPPRVAFAGARHLILAAASHERLRRLSYDYERLANVCARLDLLTVAAIWRASPNLVHARNVAPAVGILEDPATGAAAAALGGYLAELAMIAPPASFTVLQGEDLGRPSRLDVTVTAKGAGVRVAGRAVTIP